MLVDQVLAEFGGRAPIQNENILKCNLNVKIHLESPDGGSHKDVYHFKAIFGWITWFVEFQVQVKFAWYTLWNDFISASLVQGTPTVNSPHVFWMCNHKLPPGRII